MLARVRPRGEVIGNARRVNEGKREGNAEEHDRVDSGNGRLLGSYTTAVHKNTRARFSQSITSPGRVEKPPRSWAGAAGRGREVEGVELNSHMGEKQVNKHI